MPAVRKSRKKIIHRRSYQNLCFRDERGGMKSLQTSRSAISTHQSVCTETISNKLAEIMLNKALHVYQVSPLFKFSFRKRALNMLSQKIGLYMEKCIDANTYGPGSASGPKVNITHITGFHDEIAGILMIIRRLGTAALPKNNESVEATKEDFWGVLCRPDFINQNEFLTVSTNFTYLPLFLAKGRSSLLHRVTTLLAQQFDCTLRKLNFSPVELSWLGAMWAGYATDIPRRPLKFIFTTPAKIDGITSISLKVDPISITNLWEGVHNENSDKFLLEEMEVFMKSLEAHFESAFKINMAAFSLVEIHTTSLNASTSGKIKLFSSKTSPRILLHIMSLLRS